MSHWPSSAGACAPFCARCPACHAVGLPLSSNVRQHTQALRFASISNQMQLAAAVGSVQIVVPSFRGIGQGRGQAKYMSCQQCSAHVLRRSRVLPLVCLQAKPKSLQLVAMHVSQVVGAKRPLLSASHRKAAGQKSSCGLFSVVAWGGESSVVVGAR
jgi:hypothetical protein